MSVSHSVPPAAPGTSFTAIPQSGSLTAGDDTLRLRDLQDGWVSGADGDDLLVLDFSRTGLTIEADAALGFVTGYRDFSYAGTLSFADFERVSITGGAGDDVLSGGYDGAVSLRGGAGDDLFLLRGAEARVDGGDGDDEIHGARLGDLIYGGAGNDLLVVDLSDATQGVDLNRETRIAGWEGIERYAGHLTHYDDTLRGGALMTDSDGGHGIDELWLDYSDLAGSRIHLDVVGVETSYANAIIFDVEASASTSVSLQGFESFRVIGTESNDNIRLWLGHDLVRGGDGDDMLQGGGGSDTLIGGDGNDYLVGGSTSGSILRGGDGDDTINVYSLDDTVSGGAGTDSLVLWLWDASASVNLDLGRVGPAWAGLEQISGGLTNFSDVLRLTWVTGEIHAGAGTDRLILDYSRSSASAINFLWSQLKVQPPSGGVETSFFLSSFELFDLRGTIGADSLHGGHMGDRLDGYLGDDSLRGEGGDDLLLGHDGNDTLGGNDGADTLHGGTGDDWLAGGYDDDHLDGSAGDDSLSGDEGSDLLDGGSGNDTLDGGDWHDTLMGAAGNDRLFAGAGDDLLFGGGGNDVLVGGEGDDTMTGGSGSDSFRFNAGPSGDDRIEDFELSRDRLVFWQGSQLAELEISAGADGARVVWASGSVLLAGVDAAALTADHFLF